MSFYEFTQGPGDLVLLAVNMWHQVVGHQLSLAHGTCILQMQCVVTSYTFIAWNFDEECLGSLQCIIARAENGMHAHLPYGLLLFEYAWHLLDDNKALHVCSLVLTSKCS